MIKNLFFDLDDTIIKGNENNAKMYKEVLREHGYNEEDYMKIYTAIDEYEKNFTEENNIYDKNEMLDFVNKYLTKNYSYDFIEDIIKAGENWTEGVIISEDIISKLSEKYNLYVYTNYFRETQEKRVEKIGYSKYFNKVFGADEYGSKPFKNSLLKILRELHTEAEKCMLIGDTKSTDIASASNIGMKSILYDYNGKRDDKNIKLENYIVIKDMKELLDIL